MEYEILKINVQNNIGIVTISRPQVLNALNSRFLSEMEDLISLVSTREDIRVLIFTGEGKAFVAGADISEMVNMNNQEAENFSKRGQNILNNLENLPIPVIAAINGFALGGGCELAMACDFRIASNLAKFGQPEVNLGIMAGYAGTQRLPRLVGLSNALYMLLTTDMITADEAKTMGLVQKVVEPEQLMTEVIAIAEKIVSKGPNAIKITKKVTRTGMLTDFKTGCELESKEFGAMFGSESTEGMRAFLEKRKPEWNKK